MVAAVSQPQSAARSAIPAWITPELLDHTRRVWEPRYGRALTTSDLVEIVLSFSTLFRTLTRGDTHE